jgi:hypothetical protein
MTIAAFCDYVGLRPTKVRQLIASSEIESVAVGHRILVIVPSWQRYVEGLKAPPRPDARRNRAGAIRAFGSRGAQAAENATEA